MSRPSPVVLALVEALLLDDTAADADGRVSATAAVLERKIGGMSTLARTGMTGLIVCFDWWGVLRSGRRFRSQSFGQRQAQLGAWGRSSVGLFRDFVSFFSRMGTFVWYSLGTER